MSDISSQQPASIFRRALLATWVPLALLLAFTIASGTRFLSVSNLLSIAQQTIAPSIVVWGLCFALTMSILDLSPGVVIVLGGMVGTTLGIRFGYAGFIIGAIGVGLLVGLINGTVYLRLRIPSIIVTVGMVLVYEVLASFFSGGQGIFLPENLIAFATFPLNVVVWLVALVSSYILFNKSVIGGHVRAVGESERIAASVGLNVGRTKLVGFVLAATYAGLGAILYQSYGRYVEPQVSLASLALIFPPLAGFFYALSISRWVNLIIAVIIGEFTIMMLLNGLIIAGVPSTWQQFALGVVLIAVTAISSRTTEGVVK